MSQVSSGREKRENAVSVRSARTRHAVFTACLLVVASLLWSCGGGGNDLFSGCGGGCTTATSLLTAAEAEAIVARAATEASVQGAAATIAVAPADIGAGSAKRNNLP